MAKGQKRSNREPKKPAPTAASPFSREPPSRPVPARGGS
jgi:hypothetical protein